MTDEDACDRAHYRHNRRNTLVAQSFAPNHVTDTPYTMRLRFIANMSHKLQIWETLESVNIGYANLMNMQRLQCGF